jgi:hypothetical protein
MKIKTIDIPIYRCKLTMILDDNLKFIEKKYKTTSLDDFGAVTFKDKQKYRHYIVAFTDVFHLSNIAHEIVHIKNHIYLDCAMELDRFNDEPEAYLTGFLFDKIYEFLTKNNEFANDK